MYVGDFRLGDTFDVKFCTVSTTGAPTTLAGVPVVSAYPGNSTTELTAGITLSVDFDSRTGMHNVRMVATSGNGYATATNYALVITTGTVGGTSVVGYVIGHFSIENRSALMPTTAARTLDVSATGEGGVDWANVGSPTTTLDLSGTSTKALQPTTAGRTLDVTATGEAGIDWANVGAPTTTLDLSGTTIKTTQKVDVDTIKTNPVVNGGTITFPTTATLASTTNITAGTVTTATNVTTVNGLAANVITATAINADAITAAKIADGAIDSLTFAAETGLRPVRSNTAAAGAAGSIDLDASASATDSIYNDCWVFLTGGTGAGQCRLIVSYSGSIKRALISPNWQTNPDNTSTFAIFPANIISVYSLGATAQGQLRTATGLASANLDTQLSTIAGYIDTEVAAILAAVDTEVAAIKAKTDNLPEGIQKNQPLSNFTFFMTDSADHVTGKTGLTITATRRIDAGAFAACANSATEVANGVYTIDLLATDLNGDIITLKFTGTGADATIITIKTEV